MPMFSKLMGNYPMQLIRGLSPSIKMAAGRVGIGAGVGAAVGYAGDRRGGGATRGAIGGAIAGGISAGASMYGGRVSQFARNMSRPGMAGMYGGALRSKGMSVAAGASRRMSGWAGRASSMFGR